LEWQVQSDALNWAALLSFDLVNRAWRTVVDAHTMDITGDAIARWLVALHCFSADGASVFATVATEKAHGEGGQVDYEFGRIALATGKIDIVASLSLPFLL